MDTNDTADCINALKVKDIEHLLEISSMSWCYFWGRGQCIRRKINDAIKKIVITNLSKTYMLIKSVVLSDPLLKWN